MLKHNLPCSMNSKHLTLPDLGLGDELVVLSMWLVKRGARVAEGDPLVEVMAGVASVDLPAPADGVLAKKLVAEGELLAVGQRLAVIEGEW
jgi:2-oxoisovalerate dehydrogenase E2 component (dihydrolipoyl transacylase)